MIWVFEELVSWIFSLLGKVFDLLSTSFLEAFTIDTTAFSTYIPIFDAAQEIIIIMAVALSTLSLMVGLLMNMMPTHSDEMENPVMLVGRYLFAIAIAFFGKDLIALLFDLFSQIYTMLLGIENFNSWTIEGVGSAMASKLTQGYGEDIAVLIFGIFFLIAIIINFFQLLLEGAERYVVINLCMVFAPLSGALLVSKNTKGAFGAYFRMAVTQLFLMCMNVLFIRGATGMMISLVTIDNSEENLGGLTIWMILLLAFLKAGQAIDSYLRSLGLDVSQTGGTLTAELLSAGQSLSRSAFMGSRMFGDKISSMLNSGFSGRGGGAGSTREASKAYEKGVVMPGLSSRERTQKSSVNAARNLNEAMQEAGKSSGVLNPKNLDPFAMKEAVLMGTMPESAKAGNVAAAVVSSIAPQMAAAVPGFENAAVTLSKGAAMIAMGDGRSAKLTMDPPTNGKPYMTLSTTDARGNEVTSYLQNTGTKPLFGNEVGRGEQVAFQEAFGIQAPQMAQTIGEQLDLPPEEVLNANVEGIGNDCMQLTSATGEELGTVIPPNADTDLRSGIGMNIDNEALDTAALDDYQFVPSNQGISFPDSDDGFAGLIMEASDGKLYDAQKISEDFQSDNLRPVMSVDADAQGGATITYSDGGIRSLTSDDLSGYEATPGPGDVISSKCGLSQYMSYDDQTDMLNKVIGADRDETSEVIGYKRDDKNKFSDFTLADASTIRVYDADTYSVRGAGSGVVNSGKSQGYAVEMKKDQGGNLKPKAAKINYRGTPDERIARRNAINNKQNSVGPKPGTPHNK